MTVPDGLPAVSPRPLGRSSDPIELEGGRAYIASLAELDGCEAWRAAFIDQCKDHRYYRLVEQTLTAGFIYRYFVLEDPHGRVRAIQPFFFLDRDLLAGLPGLGGLWAGALRGVVDRLLKLRILMVGCPAGEAHLNCLAPADPEWVGRALGAAALAYARQARIPVVVLKDFPAQHRRPLAALADQGYCRVPSLPMTHLALAYRDFGDYMQRELSASMRMDLRRKFRRAAAAAPIHLEVIHDITPHVDAVYPLYRAVHARSAFKFEELTPAFLARIGREMPERARFFLWRQAGRIIAFKLCLVHGEAIHDEYLGLDYDVAFDLSLYFYTFREVIEWAIAHKLKHYYGGPLGYDAKLHLRCELVPLDLYVAHTSTWLNPLLHGVVRFVQPTRHVPVLRRFRNADDL